MPGRSTGPGFFTVLLAISGWAAAAVTYWRWRREVSDKESRILQRTRQELDTDPLLKRVHAILKAERERRALPEQLSGWELRRLPAVLQDLAAHWEFDSVSISAAFNSVGQEVIWCDESKILWADEQPRRSEVYWRVFNKFARAIQAERAGR